MNLEQRVRDELRRRAPIDLPVRPALDDLHAVVARRRRRNRVVLGAAAALVVVAGLGLVALDRSDRGTAVIATAPDEASAEGSAGDAAPAADDAVSAGPDDRTPPSDDPMSTPTADAESEPQPESAVDRVPLTRLEAATSPVTVETRPSAVDFAGGSGVLVVETDSGYAGLAGRFGGADGVATIGLRSENGLDWSEVEVTGVPAGATATLLREFDGTHVAMFSRFDADEQRNIVTISTSTDLVSWSQGRALPDSGEVAVDMAVGPAGVLVVGMAPDPVVWFGPLNGPFELVGTIGGATTLAGVVAVDDGFVGAGTDGESAALFTSADGTEWSSMPLSGVDGDDSLIEVSVEDGVITIAGNGGRAAWAASSNDGGSTWQRRELDGGDVESLSVRGTSMSLLGTSLLGTPVLTLADDTTWSSVDLDIDEGDRIELLVTGPETVLLAATEDGLRWIVASR